MKDSKNVEGAKEFIDYLLSDDVQKQISKAYLLPGRTDIKRKIDQMWKRFQYYILIGKQLRKNKMK